MSSKFPMRFTLDDSTQVTIEKAGDNSFLFTLRPITGQGTQFYHTEGDKPIVEVEKNLSLDEQDALRRFWLLTDNGNNLD